MTLNSPSSLLILYELANSSAHTSVTIPDAKRHSIYTAELMREIGLKCIGLNGVPRTINCLGEFHSGLPAPVQRELAKRPARRKLDRHNVVATLDRGTALWDSIYHPMTDKLTAKLAVSHPDLPVHIVESEYGALFSDPATSPPPGDADAELRPDVGRVLMSIVAIATLRAQSGVGPQVLSHVFGLRKAFEDGTAHEQGQLPVEGGPWLATDEGSVWLLEHVDRIVADIGGGEGSTFASGPRAKL